jgi:hypothetical protein
MPKYNVFMKKPLTGCTTFLDAGFLADFLCKAIMAILLSISDSQELPGQAFLAHNLQIGRDPLQTTDKDFPLGIGHTGTCQFNSKFHPLLYLLGSLPALFCQNKLGPVKLTGNGLLAHKSSFCHDRHHPGHIRFILAAKLRQSGSRNAVGVLVQSSKVDRMGTIQIIFSHFLRSQFVPATVNLRNCQGEPGKTI